MNDFQGTGVLILLFALRCLVPLALTLGVAYLMDRMVDKWEHEATQQQQNSTPESIPLTMVEKDEGEAQRPLPSLPCWLTKGCDPAHRPSCPAYQQRGKPCWVARMTAESALPDNCPNCPIYRQAHA